MKSFRSLVPYVTAAELYVVWMSVIYVPVNLAADLLYHWLDPRVRYGGDAA